MCGLANGFKNGSLSADARPSLEKMTIMVKKAISTNNTITAILFQEE